MKQTEIILAAAIILLMLLRLWFTYPYAALSISLLCLILSLLYGIFSFGLLNQIRFRNIFKKEAFKDTNMLRILGAIGTGFVLSLITISNLFKYQSWPYGNIILLIGLVSLIPIYAFIIFKFFYSRSKFYTTLLIRLSIIAFIGVLLYFTTAETLLEMKFRDFPEYVEAEKKALKTPDNRALQEAANTARLKMEISK